MNIQGATGCWLSSHPLHAVTCGQVLRCEERGGLYGYLLLQMQRRQIALSVHQQTGSSQSSGTTSLVYLWLPAQGLAHNRYLQNGLNCRTAPRRGLQWRTSGLSP